MTASHRHLRRRLTTAAALLASALSVTACGSGSSGHSGTHTTAPVRSSTAARGSTPHLSGRAIFLSAGCAGCHTLAAAGSDGNVGPNLDTLKPTDATVIHQVTHGGGGMPAFAGQLSPAQIRQVAAFVSSSTH